MRPEDMWKRYQEAGADFVEVARSRAEAILRELTKVSDATQRQAEEAFDEAMGGSRAGAEQLLTAIRREVAAGLAVLGIATKDDLAAMEERLSRLVTSSGTGEGKPAAQPATASEAAPPGTAARRATSRGGKTAGGSSSSRGTGAAKRTRKASATSPPPAPGEGHAPGDGDSPTESTGT